jgi:hypothetical protein
MRAGPSLELFAEACFKMTEQHAYVLQIIGFAVHAALPVGQRHSAKFGQFAKVIISGCRFEQHSDVATIKADLT